MPPKKIALVANTAWNIWNYRLAFIKSLEREGYEVLCIAPDDRFREKLLAATRSRFVPLRFLSRKSLSVFQNLQLLLELWRVFRQEKPDCLIFYTIKPNTIGHFAAKLAGIPAISTVEGLGHAGSATSRLRFLMGMLYKMAFRFARKVIFLNYDDHRIFTKQGIVAPEKAIVIHGPGIDTAFFSPRETANFSKTSLDAPIFLFIGRFLLEKGLRDFAQAARILRARNIRAEIQLLGDLDKGNPSSVTQEELEGWKTEGILRHLGHADDVRDVLATADVVVLPSFYREGVPRSVLEGMAMGKTIITTNNAGCRDTVEEGKNGFLVAPQNPEALANAIEQYTKLPENLRKTMSQHSREKVVAEFSDELVLPQYLKLIREVLQKPNSEA